MSDRIITKHTVKHGDYSLTLDLNALCEVEDQTGRGFFDVHAEVFSGNCKLKTMRAIVHASLLQHHQDATVAQAGDILGENPNIIFELFGVSMPDETEKSEAPKPGKKPRA